MDTKAIEYHVLGLLKAIGEDPEREGLRETPARVAQMLEEVLEGTALYDMTVNVAYIPKGRVLGLSKIARICDMAAKRLQLQERLGRDICEIISEAAGTPDVGVVISGCHSCMTARGIRNDTAKTVTTTYRGKFREDKSLQALIEAR